MYFQIKFYGILFCAKICTKTDGPAALEVRKDGVDGTVLGKIDSSWCVTVSENGSAYVITAASWNGTIPAHGAVDFGIQGSGSIGNSIGFSFE